MLKILNLYGSLGGNRYKWDEVADIKVTSIENDPDLNSLYKTRFPNDIIICTDAHQYLLEHYDEYDYIWSSPPCPSHSRAKFWGTGNKGRLAEYPDMKLYAEIILLKYFYKGRYTVENVVPYYTPMLNPKMRGRHLYWTNFGLPSILSSRSVYVGAGKDEIYHLSKFHEFDFTRYKGKQRIDKVARNLVDFEAGKVVFEHAVKAINEDNYKPQTLF